jgi:hypothetical protein
MAERKKAGGLTSLWAAGLGHDHPAGREHPFSFAYSSTASDGERMAEKNRPQHPTVPLVEEGSFVGSIP